MLKVAIIIIGDEILLGRVADTNSGVIARAMDAAGCRTVSVTTVGDEETSIREAVESALGSADLVFTTGGLGPTKDDITKHVLLNIFGGSLIRDDAVTQNIEKIFEGRNLKLNRLTLDQALVPSTAHIIQNRFGTAPIMVFHKDSKFLVSMPGVPNEMEGSLPYVLKYLSTKISIDTVARHSTFVVTGLAESALALRLEDFEKSLPITYKLAYLPDTSVIKLRLDAYDDLDRFEYYENLLNRTLGEIRELHILGIGEKSLGQLVVERLATKGQTLATAESCTGGNIARTITGVAGASTVFNGGAVTYSNSAKTNILGVGSETLKTYGAVSRQVVVQMAEGACNEFSTDYAVATSGIAGPGGGTLEKPVGTVWIAVKSPSGVVAECYHFPGNRNQVIARTTTTALIGILKSLKPIL